MLKYLLPLFLLGLVACGETSSDNNKDPRDAEEEGDEVLQPEVEEVVYPDYFMSRAKFDTTCLDTHDSTYKYWIVNYKAAATHEEAQVIVDSLLPTYPQAGYLWIPDFKALSGKELFVVYLAGSKYEFSVLEDFKKAKQELKSKPYMVRVGDNERYVRYSAIDIRIDGERQKMVAIYSKPQDEEEYASEGGEDWGWFVHDVTTHFSKHHPDLMFTSIYHEDLTEKEIETLEDELGLYGFGYIMIDGKEKGFTGHDLPDGVIYNINEFFGFEQTPMEY